MTKGEKRREEILSVARELLLRNGYEAFVLREVSEKAGMTLGNLQYYFPTRAALLEEIGMRDHQIWLRQMEAIRSDEGSPEEKIRRVVNEVVGDWHDGGGKILIMLAILGFDHPRYQRSLETVYREFHDALGSILSELEPNASQEWIAHKVRLMTCLMDGSLLQPDVELRNRKDRKRLNEFLAELGDAALLLAGHK